MMRPPRICMVIDYYYPVLGGSEIQAYRLTRWLSKMGQKVFVVTRRHPDHPAPIESNEGKVYRLPVLGKKRMASLGFVCQVFLFLIIHRSEYDIIHCHLITSTALACLMAGRITNTPVLIKLGGSGKSGDIQTSLNTKAGRLKLMLLKRGSCHFVAPSMQIAREMIASGFIHERIKVIPNGVDTELFSSISPFEKGVRKGRLGLNGVKLAIYIGRLEPEKGILLMVDAWSRVYKKLKDWRLWIIGSGVLQKVIKARILERGMDDSIFLFPPVLPDRVRDYLQIADLLIHPSSSEGLSNAILEGMSSELPVIASKIESNQTLIQDGFNGLLFTPGDIEGLKKCLEMAVKDDKTRTQWGINGRSWICENLDLHRVTVQYIQFYQKICSDHFFASIKYPRA